MPRRKKKSKRRPSLLTQEDRARMAQEIGSNYRRGQKFEISEEHRKKIIENNKNRALSEDELLSFYGEPSEHLTHSLVRMKKMRDKMRGLHQADQINTLVEEDTPKKRYVCNLCPYGYFDDIDDVEAHVRLKHGVPGPLIVENYSDRANQLRKNEFGKRRVYNKQRRHDLAHSMRALWKRRKRAEEERESQINPEKAETEGEEEEEGKRGQWNADLRRRRSEYMKEYWRKRKAAEAAKATEFEDESPGEDPVEQQEQEE